MQIETVFFDAGNTLCHLDMETISRHLAELGFRAPPDALRRAELEARGIIDDPALISRSTDGARWSGYLHAIFAGAGIRMEDREATLARQLRDYHKRHNLWTDLPQEVPPLLDRLRERDLRLAVVSNSNGTVRQKLDALGISRYFADVIDSHHVGVEKPDPRIFHIALQRTGARARSTMHVGDLYHVDVVGARSAGLTPVLLDPIGRHADKNVARIRSLPEIESLLFGLP